VSLVLASGSPQRREILQKLGLEFDVVVPGVDELTGGDPDFEVVENARLKAYAVARAGGEGVGWCPAVPEAVEGEASDLDARDPSARSSAQGKGGHPTPSTGPARLVIACDTDVVLDGKALGKPADVDEAREYLDRMSGRSHEVLSGLVVLSGGEERSGLDRTTVVFKQLDEAAKERYVRFGEWRGRSGGYAIQTLGSSLVERIEGSVSNVVGLPVGLLLELAPELFEP
jgi:septum formation protein